jgi:hypothetical protein
MARLRCWQRSTDPLLRAAGVSAGGDRGRCAAYTLIGLEGLSCCPTRCPRRTFSPVASVTDGAHAVDAP